MESLNRMDLIYSLIGYPSETEWLEFKESNANPEQIGKDISALANSAALHEREYAYKIWGVTDDTPRALVGTAFNPEAEKARGNQGLLIWLSTMLSRNAGYRFRGIEHNGLAFVVLEIDAAVGQPVLFQEKAYIREGESTTPLKGGSAKEKKLWQRLQLGDFELKTALPSVPAQDIAQYLDIHAYFDCLGVREPSDLGGVLMALSEQELVRAQDDGDYAITNLGALLVARSLQDYPGLRKRAIRLVRYDGEGNFGIVDDQTYDMGYALALGLVAKDIAKLTPAKETIVGAQRVIDHMFPAPAVRELLSNMVIHQDLADTTAGPLIGVYSNRLEFSNPGASLISVERVLNAQPRTRNMMLVEVMREMDLCEEGGTGWDIAVGACEAAHLAAPKMTSDEESGTKVTLYGDRAYKRMSKAERKDAVYWHACLMHAQGKSMGNRSLRERFGLDDSKKNIVAVSRLIRECIDDASIKEEDEATGDKFKRYVPYWA